ncbi:MAG: 2-oxoacid:acceptor oxidoreductase family protein [Sulfolobales archaeon]
MLRYEIRFHGRGGQGVVTAAELLAYAAILEGYYAQAFPEFGAERRGAPVRAYFRLDDSEPIVERYPITNPDMVVIFDESLLRQDPPPYNDLKANGWLIINTSRNIDEIRKPISDKRYRLALINATDISMSILKRPIVNTTILGAVIKLFNIIKLESVEKALLNRFSGNLAKLNIEAIKKGYESVVIDE